jgi:hypothetical protein
MHDPAALETRTDTLRKSAVKLKRIPMMAAIHNMNKMQGLYAQSATR